VEEAESKVHHLETKLAQLEQELQAASGMQAFAQLQRISQAYADTQTALEQALERWASLAEA